MTSTLIADVSAWDRTSLVDRYRAVRDRTVSLVRGLPPDDLVPQSMPDASPAKWHLGHTSWFFSAFILDRFGEGYVPFDPAYDFLFNSYYEAMGPRHARPHRGLLTRPTVAEVMAFRSHVDTAITRLIESKSDEGFAEIAPLIILGTHHEEQHQELLLTDLLHLFAQNPIRPAFRSDDGDVTGDRPPAINWIDVAGGIHEIGHDGPEFAYDNETPRHTTLLQPCRIADRLVTNAEWLDFMADDGYRRSDLWLSDGWATLKTEEWESPFYWEMEQGSWHQMTLGGLLPIDPCAPVSHVSYYEADAFARWAGKRLPTEFEWEVASQQATGSRNDLAAGVFRPRPADDQPGLKQMFGDVWEWTQSAYGAYPGFAPATGAVGEYNGKFMCNQYVLRGGSCVTPPGHTRATYRNFFYPHQRWQFMGLRLAEDA